MGRAVNRFLTRNPVPGASITSSFGMRQHPLSGQTHLHSGVDFAAPMSTKIYATGAGVVAERGRDTGYGRFLRIRHANGFETLYAHLSGYSYKMQTGASVASSVCR